MGLDVHMLGTEQVRCPFYCKVFCYVYELASAVVPLARIAFSIFICHYTALGFHDCPACIIL